MSDDGGPRSREFSGWRLANTISVVLVVALIAYLAGRSSVPMPTHDDNLRIYGLDSPTQNRLNSRFADANGDLIADLPAPELRVDPEILTFSYLAVDQPRYAELWSTFVEHLREHTGKPVEYLQLESTNDQLDAVCEGRLHITGINAGNIPMAVNRCGFVPIVALGNGGAVQTYTMRVVVKPDSPVQTVENLRGRTLTLTSPGSNSGWKAPLRLLMQHYDMHPVRDFMVNCSDSHQASIRGIVSGEFEVASVASDEMELMKGRGDLADEQLRLVYESKPFPQNCMGHVHNLVPELASKIRSAFLSFEWEGTPLRDEFDAVGVGQFVELDYKRDFELIREIDDAVGRRHEPK